MLCVNWGTTSDDKSEHGNIANENFKNTSIRKLQSKVIKIAHLLSENVLRKDQNKSTAAFSTISVVSL